MRTIGSATYLRDRARRRLARGLWLLIAGAAVVVAGFVSAQGPGARSLAWLGGLPVFFCLASVLVGALQLIAAARDREAVVGEVPVVAQLKARFGDEYVYLYRVTIPGRGAEADGILLGPHGALVLAIRAAHGQLVVRGDDWFTQEASGERRLWARSPTWQVVRPVRALERLGQEEGLGRVPVQGAVVLAQARLLEAEQPAVAVVPADRIATYVQYLRPETAVAPDLVERLVEALAPHAGGAEQGREQGRRK